MIHLTEHNKSYSYFPGVRL